MAFSTLFIDALIMPQCERIVKRGGLV